MTTGGRLFDPGPAEGPSATGPPPSNATATDARPPVVGTPVRVLPDVSGLEKEFDYVVPADMVGPLAVGSEVRIELQGRRVNGWITAVAPDPPADVALLPVVSIRSAGPSPEIVDLARWAAHRWYGRVGAVLRTASAPRVVRSLDRPASAIAPEARGDVSLLRHGPADDVLGWILEAAERGSTLVVVPRVGQARSLAGRLRQRGVTARSLPRDWAAAAGRGGVVIGARSAVWASVADLSTIIVVDEHDESLQEERHPTWHARDVAVERARRAGIPCWLLSPSPSLEAVAAADHQRTPARARERAAWPVVDVVDRRDDEPGKRGLFSSRLVDVFREEGTALAVLNRKGRAVMLACGACGELALTEDGDRLMVEQDGRLLCPATGETRPMICAACTSTRLKRLRLGVTRAAEELSAMLGEPVAELSASTVDRDGTPPSRITVGTEAALHQLLTVDTVAFLDFDQELLAPRYRAAEQAMTLLVRAAQLVGGRDEGGRLLVQSRRPDHRVLRAAAMADPGRLLDDELEIRRTLGLPPFGALAELRGKGATAFAAALETTHPELTVMGPRQDDRFLVRAEDSTALAAALADTPRPAERVSVLVDPLRA